MSKKKGKKFNAREVAPNKDDGELAQGNQWQATEQQLKWLDYYMNPREKETYANAYQAAIKAGYSETYAKVIASKHGPEWAKSGRIIMRSMNTDHLTDQLEKIVMSNDEKASDKIAAIKLLGMEQGMFVQKQITAHTGIEDALAALE